MTVIVALANHDFTIHVADRRLSVSGMAVTEEEGKVGSIQCDNARFLYGFTGLARIGQFQTRRWILDALYDSGPPEYTIYEILQRFTDRATRDFRDLPELKAVSPADRRLTILLTGYLYTHDPPVVGLGVVSNCLDPPTDELSPVAWAKFESYYTTEKEPGSSGIAYVQRIGAHGAMNAEDLLALKSLMIAGKPAEALVGKATDLMLQMAERPAAGNTIGKQVTWLKLTPNPETSIESGYYSNVPTSAVYMPPGVIVQSHRQVAFDAGVARVEGPNPPPLRVPKTGRNSPCPCGSGKKYKRCHGR